MGNESMILHHRRVLTMQAQAADEEESELGGVYRKVRDDISGTPIPNDFPRRADLITAGYAAVEDLQDVTEAELAGRGLSRRAARAVLTALAALET